MNQGVQRRQRRRRRRHDRAAADAVFLRGISPTFNTFTSRGRQNAVSDALEALRYRAPAGSMEMAAKVRRERAMRFLENERVGTSDAREVAVAAPRPHAASPRPREASEASEAVVRAARSSQGAYCLNLCSSTCPREAVKRFAASVLQSAPHDNLAALLDGSSAAEALEQVELRGNTFPRGFAGGAY